MAFRAKPMAPSYFFIDQIESYRGRNCRSPTPIKNGSAFALPLGKNRSIYLPGEIRTPDLMVRSHRVTLSSVIQSYHQW